MAVGAGISPGAAVAAANLRVDATAVEVVEALRAEGVDAIVLKGPATVHWLGEEAARAYADCDLIIPVRQVDDAGRVLHRLAFEPHMEGVDLGERWTHPARMWSRGEERIDLHHGLAGAEASPDVVWSELRSRTSPLRRGRSELTILDPTATALVLALHAAQHGTAVPQPLRDLRLALAGLQPDVWAGAAALAERIDAAGAFATGLRLVPEGASVAESLSLPDAPSVSVALAAASAPPQALALEQLASKPGLRGKLAFARSRLAPPAAWMRASYPVARRGRAALLAAHAWRLATAPVRLARAVPAWRRARREAA